MNDSLHALNPDLVIVGGGLAGGLIALALHRHAPDLRFLVIEAGEALGGNHRWSWFASDVDEAGAELLAGFDVNAWDDGYEIDFPDYGKVLPTGYRSLSSEQFHASLSAELPPETLRLGTRVAALDADGVTLGSGERVAAGKVIDCRTFTPSTRLAGGWQVFLGQHIKCDQPHGLTRPVIMDATVDQVAPFGNGGAYRFVYVLPLAAREVFVEDTYYSDTPALDGDALGKRIAAYAANRGWQGARVTHEESGVLPVVMSGDFAAYWQSGGTDIAKGGVRAGLFHPMTSYSLPEAVRFALALGEAWAPNGGIANLHRWTRDYARARWRANAFYRLLARMLFRAAEPDERYRLLERFYRLPEALIGRFYAGQSTHFDKIRILSGKPPVAIGKALKAMIGKRA